MTNEDLSGLRAGDSIIRVHGNPSIPDKVVTIYQIDTRIVIRKDDGGWEYYDRFTGKLSRYLPAWEWGSMLIRATPQRLARIVAIVARNELITRIVSFMAERGTPVGIDQSISALELGAWERTYTSLYALDKGHLPPNE